MASADDGRPAGGTARTPGNKTPRKVQWLDAPAQLDKADSSHALDEHGLDPDAFETLTHALERHRSASPEVQPAPRLPPIITQIAPEASEPEARRHHSASDDTTAINTATNTASNTDRDVSPRAPSPTHDVPGNFIDPNERAGLPGTRDLEGFAEAEANKLVRAHTRKRGLQLFNRKKKGPPVKEKVADIERRAEADAASTYPSGGGGLLSTLLTLYDQQNASGASTPAHSSVEDLLSNLPERPWVDPAITREDARRERQSFEQDRARQRRRRSYEASSLPGSPPSESDSPNRSTDSPHKSSHGLGRTLTSGSAASLAFLGLPARPPQVRNGAGVFGSLIASTGNLSGVAAPVPSTLAPNIKRPGYHLSRYSLESNLPTRPRAKVIERPRSMHFETNMNAYSPVVRTASPTPSTPTPPSPTPPVKGKWLPKGINHVLHSGRSTPTTEGGDEWADEKAFLDEDRRREKRQKRRKAEVYITRHVAQILQRHEFVLKLARALMMFGGPSHRLQAQIQATARVLDVELSCMYLPDVMLISFDDGATGTSSVRLVRQGSALDLDKLGAAYDLYWQVIHDELSVAEASAELDTLMRRPARYNFWQLVLIGGMCSSAICTVSFSGSFIDALIVFPLGALLVAIQLLSVRNELYSNIFEISVATLFSFVAAVLASTGRFCYSAVISSAVVLILPGFIVLCGSLELMSRNIVSGSVRLCYAVVYSLFLGFGLAMGAEAYEKITGKAIVGPEDYTCAISHADAAWYQRTPSHFWAFLTVPMYSLFLSMRQQQSWQTKEMFLLVAIACVGWVTNHFTGTKFVNQNDISAAVGAFAVGIVANLYGRLFSGNAFVIMITGILFQLPSGLGNGGLLTFASQQTAGSATSYLSGFQTALQLISVSIGLAVGLGISLVVVHPVLTRRRAGGVFSL